MESWRGCIGCNAVEDGECLHVDERLQIIAGCLVVLKVSLGFSLPDILHLHIQLNALTPNA